MRLYFDENFSFRLAHALKELEKGRPEKIEVLHITDEFPRGTADEVWIPAVAQRKGIMITQDFNIHKTRILSGICESCNLPLVFFKPPKKTSYTYWEWVELVIAHWSQLTNEMVKANKRFIIEVTERSLKRLL